jgi:hypothetical protein
LALTVLLAGAPWPAVLDASKAETRGAGEKGAPQETGAPAKNKAEQQIERDARTRALEQEIAALTKELLAWEGRARRPERELGYRIARAKLEAAKKKLRAVRAPLADERLLALELQLADVLGARLGPPSATLVDQLELPKGQGLVVRELRPGSTGAKAGLRTHDILLELGSKSVPSSLEDFSKQVQALARNKPLDVVVMRRGRTEKLKGLVLPARNGRAARTPEGPLD